MSVTFVVIFGAVALVLTALALALHKTPDERQPPRELQLPEAGRAHATYFPVIRQAMSQQDFEFLRSRAPGRAARRAHRERERIALIYLADLRADFLRLLRLARVIAVLSPEVAASHEFTRLALTVRFALHYRLVLTGLRLGLLLMPQLSAPSQMASELSLGMELAMKQLGERAALATDLVSALNRRGLDAA